MQNNTQPRRMFTSELLRLQRTGQLSGVQDASTDAPDFPGVTAVNPSNQEVLTAIAALKDDIRHLLEKKTAEERAEMMSKEKEALDTYRSEVDILRTEVRALARCIHQTKQEIAALRPSNSDDDRITAVSNELDAIVDSTENATETILETAEKIDGLVSTIRGHVKDSYGQAIADEIADNVITIFESCNFQDITGQRITKVVNTLSFIEARVNAMVDIWGKESFLTLGDETEKTSGDDRLLNGPQLANKGISQDDIDKLFG